ncbi:hypothetical protein V8E53_002411 [Lactarius tabidus]
MSSSSLPESGMRTPPPASAPFKSFPVGKVQPYFIQHKRNQVQKFDVNVQQLETLTPKKFLECLGVSDNVLTSNISDSHYEFSINGFLPLANGIAQSIKARHFPNDDKLLVFKDMEYKTPNAHITGTECRPDITAVFEKDWIEDHYTDWALIRLAGERASSGKSFNALKKNAAMYLHYLLLARPDFLVAQSLLTTKNGVVFFVGIGGVGIQQLEINWSDENLYKFIYAFIYCLYNPSHFADPSYTRTGFDKETSEATYTVRFKTKECPNFRLILARNPFATRTHVLYNPSLTQGGDRPPTVLKEQLCRTGRCFDELTILTKIHRLMNVPGVVEAVGGEIIPALLSPGREKHRLGLRQTGSPFTSIPTAKIMLEMLFDLLEVLRFLHFRCNILHRDISIGNMMYIENPEIPAQNVEPLVFAKYLLGESKVPQKTSLLLVDFNLGEDLQDKKDGNRIERTGTPIFIARAVERGGPVPLSDQFIYILPEVPKSPECYANAQSKQMDDFPEEIEVLVDPRKVKNQPQDDGWRHELDHDVESVFWLLLYWAMVAQPEGCLGEYIDSGSWTSMLKDSDHRAGLVSNLSSGPPPQNLLHSVYEPVWPLISNLAALLVVDSHWIPESSARKRPDYMCEAFQCLILQFINSKRSENFMTCRVADSLRQVEGVPQSQALSTTPSQLKESER